MATYFKSSQVHVFPCAYRGYQSGETITTYDPEARLNTEKNLTNTGNNLKGTYLIERKYTQGSVDLLRVVIGGYYFEIDLASSVTGTKKWNDLAGKYLAIKTINNITLTGEYKTTLLVAWESTEAGYLDNSDGNFLGLAIEDGTSIPQNATAYIKVADNDGSILNDAYLPGISSSTGSKSLASSGCTANGDHATAFGKGLTGTDTAGQMVIGSYNGSADGKLFVIGKGSVGSTSNAFTVDTDGNTYIAGTLRATGNTTIGDNKFTVAASTGNTTIGGTLGVTGTASLSSTLRVTGNTTIGGTLGVTGPATFNGAIDVKDNTILNNAYGTTTKLNHNTSSGETILEHGYFTFGGNLSSNYGFIDSDGNAVFLGSQGVSTDKLRAGNATNITLASNLVKSDNNLTISSTYTNISCATTNISGALSVGNVSSAAPGRIHAAQDVVANGDLLGTDLYLSPSSGASTIVGEGASGKLKCNFIECTNTNNIAQSGQINAAITLKGTSITTAASHITLAGNAIYSITFVDTAETASAGRVVSSILALPNSITQIDHVSSAVVQESYSGSNYKFFAERTSTSAYVWNVYIDKTEGSSSNNLTGKWYVVKLCNVTF